jgi:hypothetical protein
MSGALAVGAAVGALATHGVRRFSNNNNISTTTTGESNAASFLGLSSSSLNNGNSNNHKHVGIVAMEVYTPSTYIKQEQLEEHSGVPAGKYTIGLGQEGLGFCGDAEDVNSLALTVVHSLLEK